MFFFEKCIAVASFHDSYCGLVRRDRVILFQISMCAVAVFADSAAIICHTHGRRVAIRSMHTVSIALMASLMRLATAGCGDSDEKRSLRWNGDARGGGDGSVVS